MNKSQNSNYKNNINIFSNNTPKNTIQTGYSGSRIFGVFLLSVVVLVLGYASYWLYNYYSTKQFIKPEEVEVMPDVKNASSKFNIGSGSIPNSNYSNEYSISCWINIADYTYNYGKEKVIMRRGEAGSGNPEIVLGAKTNDLIVRLKLQGDEHIVDAFQDIHIPIEDTMNTIQETSGKNFNMNNSPDSVYFNNSNNKNNKNYEELLKNKLGDNEVDFPTVQYISNDEHVNNKYFSMVSGNTLEYKTTNSIEKFTDITDATNNMVEMLVVICDITTYLKSTEVTNTIINFIKQIFNNVIELIEKMRIQVQNGEENFEIIKTEFESKMSEIKPSDDTYLNNKLKILEELSINLKQFEGTTIEYNVIKSAVNSKMSQIKCPLTIDGLTETDGKLSFYENFIKLLKETLEQFINNLSKSMKTHTDEINNASCIVDNSLYNDPTVGHCIVKMIPLQKWVNIIVSVYNQVVDIYIDGQLASSCVLKRFPKINTKDVELTPDGGFSGMISRVKFTNAAMTIQQAKSIYYEGPIFSESLFSIVPNWVYWGLLILIIVSIGYSFM